MRFRVAKMSRAQLDITDPSFPFLPVYFLIEYQDRSTIILRTNLDQIMPVYPNLYPYAASHSPLLG